MQTRREFITLSARLALGAGVTGNLLESIGRAAAIEPAAGSSVLDAQHVVVLMQENRSFDHLFGTLRGVRGFNDPRAITLPDGNPVWVQTDAAGQKYAPFRFDLQGSNITWLGTLPHDRGDQVSARNQGHYDKWLIAKRSSTKEYAAMPLSLGYYTRADLPFYYALADAFTVCDQYFCSSLTATTPNRLYHWTGTVRAKQSVDSPAHLYNDNADLDHLVEWPTFPERLQAAGVAWKVYQNELTMHSGLNKEQGAWLGNYGDNPLEYFSQYHVQLSAGRRSFIEQGIQILRNEVATLQRATAANGAESAKLSQLIAERTALLKQFESERDGWATHGFAQLPAQEQAIHLRAFATNSGDLQSRELTEISYQDGGTLRRMQVPAGDLLHRFREDVKSGNLPTVSWLVSPERFSDHPSSPWYGAWYIAEVLDILTSNPEVWKKTVFILNYDENDGYFDHVPPFVAPHPRSPQTGRVTQGIDAELEFAESAADRKRDAAASAQETSIGLGYRVPMVIASPWSRGGCVCSQVFDHTSVLRFLETLLTHKLGKKLEEPNISSWRRTVCGDLTSSFQATAKDDRAALPFPQRDAFLESIHRAQYKQFPTGYHALSADELEQIRRDPRGSHWLPRQEAGVRPSCPLPYQLTCDGVLNEARTLLTIRFEAHKDLFGDRTAGAPFVMYAMGGKTDIHVRNYAVAAGVALEDTWPLSAFEEGKYHLRAYGPNGFYREFSGGPDDPALLVVLRYTAATPPGSRPSGAAEIVVANRDSEKSVTINVRDNVYKNAATARTIEPGKLTTIPLDTKNSARWYDLSIRVAGHERFERRYAGRIDNGEWSTSDPAMA